MEKQVTLLSQPGGSADASQLFNLTDRGLLLGDGVFDTSLVVKGEIILRDAHLSRLCRDAAALGIDVKQTNLEAIADEALVNGGNGSLRITVTRGPGQRGLSYDGAGEPTRLARFMPGKLVFPMPPLRLMLSDIRRNPTAPSSRHKTLAYTDSIVGHQRARTAGFDDALYRTPGGQLACTSMANIFARFGNELVTPPLGDGVLEGVMRGCLLERASEAGFSTLVASLSLQQIELADQVFVTNSLQLIRPVSAINDTRFGVDLPPPLVSLFKGLVSGT